MEHARSIAVLVHNDVVRDARVRKEVRTLADAGYQVDVYGITSDKSAPAIQQFEGASLRLLRTQRKNRLKLWLRWTILVTAGLLFGALTVLAFMDGEISAIARWFMFLMVPIILLVLNGFRRGAFADERARRLFSMLLGCAASAVSLVLCARGYLPWYEGIAQIVLQWLIAGSGVSYRHINTVVAPLKAFARRKVTLRARHAELAKLLYGAVKKKKYDVVHCHDLIGLIAGRQLKIDLPETVLIWDAHEIYEGTPDVSEEYFKFCREIIINSEAYIDRFITINPSISDFYANNYNLPPASVVMNATIYEAPAFDDGRLHAATGLPREQKILLFQGGFANYRGLSQLMRAAPLLPEDWSIVAMGWGALQQELEQVARACMTPDRPPALVIIPPAPQTELAAWTAGATIGIIPYENVCPNHLYCTPNKIWEFPNAGVPILATDVVEMGAIIREWQTGFLLKRDFTEWDIVRFLHRTSDEAIAIAKGNCDKFAREFGWSRFAPVLIDLYRSLPLSNSQLDLQKPSVLEDSISSLRAV
ncbi:MAG: glycosyltransferase family 4 protein [Mesorhizobium sp.]